MQGVVYRQLPVKERKRLHNMAATEIREELRRAADSKHAKQTMVAQLAHHYQLSGRDRPALKYLSMAASFALEHTAYADALAFFEDAPTQTSPIGAKGCGEAGTIAGPPAIASAICNALGLKHIDMPYTPEKIWRLLQQ